MLKNIFPNTSCYNTYYPMEKYALFFLPLCSPMGGVVISEVRNTEILPPWAMAFFQVRLEWVYITICYHGVVFFDVKGLLVFDNMS